MKPDEIINEIRRLQNLLASTRKDSNIDDVFSRKPLTDGLRDVLDKNGFMTGSAFYMDESEPPDIDWVVNVPPEVFGDHVIYCDNKLSDKQYETGGFTACYGHYRGKVINIICVSKIEVFRAWYQTTAAMKMLAEIPRSVMCLNAPPADKWVTNAAYFKEMKEVLSNKYNRVRLFQAFLDIFEEPSPLVKPLSYSEAKLYSKCKECGREARHFTSAKYRYLYRNTGICERCTRKKVK